MQQLILIGETYSPAPEHEFSSLTWQDFL